MEFKLMSALSMPYSSQTRSLSNHYLSAVTPRVSYAVCDLYTMEF